MDNAAHVFKNAVESIFDCPKTARDQKDKLEVEFARRIAELYAENASFDVKGGKHDL